MPENYTGDLSEITPHQDVEVVLPLGGDPRNVSLLNAVWRVHSNVLQYLMKKAGLLDQQNIWTALQKLTAGAEVGTIGGDWELIGVVPSLGGKARLYKRDGYVCASINASSVDGLNWVKDDAGTVASKIEWDGYGQLTTQLWPTGDTTFRDVALRLGNGTLYHTARPGQVGQNARTIGIFRVDSGYIGSTVKEGEGDDAVLAVAINATLEDGVWEKIDDTKPAHRMAIGQAGVVVEGWPVDGDGFEAADGVARAANTAKAWIGLDGTAGGAITVVDAFNASAEWVSLGGGVEVVRVTFGAPMADANYVVAASCGVHVANPSVDSYPPLVIAKTTTYFDFCPRTQALARIEDRLLYSWRLDFQVFGR